jgi:hypothetical protein
MGPSDTSPDAEAFLLEGYRRMSPAEKLQCGASLNRAVVQLASARIRAQFGDVPEREMRLRLGSLWLGRETMVEVFGWDPGGGRLVTAWAR